MADNHDGPLEDALQDALSQAAAGLPPDSGPDDLRDALAAALRGRLRWASAVNAPDRITSYALDATAVVDVDLGVRTRFAGRVRGCVVISRHSPADALATCGAALRLGALSGHVLAQAEPGEWDRGELREAFTTSETATVKRLQGWRPTGDRARLPIPARTSLRLIAQVPHPADARTLRLYRMEIPDGAADLAA